MKNIILQGDALTKLKELPEKSINMCMTSPPYWALRDYGTAKWEGGDKDCDHLNGTLQSMKTTLHPGTNQNDKRNFTGMPFKEICGKCGAKRTDHQLGLEPTFDEYISDLCDIFDEVKRVLRDDGTCWVNLGDCYAGQMGKKNGWTDNKAVKDSIKKGVTLTNKTKIIHELPQKCLVGIPARFQIEMCNRGWILRNTIIWHKNSCMPSSAKDRFTIDFEYIFFFSKQKKYYFEQQVEDTKAKVIEPRMIEEKREVYYAKNKDGQGVKRSMKRNMRTTWTINPKPFKEAHFAVYPEALCETPIKAGCPTGGIVLDPFFGAGTTGLVALKQNKNFIGIELNPEYIKIAEKRLKPIREQSSLNLNKATEGKNDSNR